ncbi:actin binding protein [Planoprotostelium fungivorum]|uniref:Coronin n=1 Tax=Planoprotostelium fungivorum TaxID=1890364 RepID=A0A2P6N8P6_9EUKA|nr:actin binding protein [Planoprotostelium fungivorum]
MVAIYNDSLSLNITQNYDNPCRPQCNIRGTKCYNTMDYQHRINIARNLHFELGTLYILEYKEFKCPKLIHVSVNLSFRSKPTTRWWLRGRIYTHGQRLGQFTKYMICDYPADTTSLLDSIVNAWDPGSIPGRGALLTFQALGNPPSETLFRLYNHRKGTLKEIDSNGALRMDHFSPDFWNMHDNKISDPNAWIPTRKTKSGTHFWWKHMLRNIFLLVHFQVADASACLSPRNLVNPNIATSSALRFSPPNALMGSRSVQLDANPVKANGRFLAVPWALTGTVAVIPLSHKGSVHPEHPLILQEDRTVNDLQFASTDDNLLATANSDGTVSFWRIPDGGYEQSPAAPEREYKVSEKRVMNLSFHPLASDVLLTADAAKSVQLWDVSTGQSRASLPDHQAAPTSFCWSADGKLVASSCKDKKVRLFDPRASSPLVASAEDHSGVKGAQNTFVGKQGEPELLLTAGSSKGTDRELALWDPRSFGKRLTTVRVDTGSSHLFPYADRDLGLVYVAGKGDGNIRYYELGSDEPMLHYLNEFKSKDPQTGLALLPKTNVDAVKCEIARFIKVSPNGLATSIRFEVPRRENSFFQDDLFPNTFDRKATTNADGWFSGSDASPHYISLNPEK